MVNWLLKHNIFVLFKYTPIWYCNQQPKHYVITVPTRTILHPQLEVNAITDFYAIPTSVCSMTQAKKSISRQPICLTDADYDYIL